MTPIFKELNLTQAQADKLVDVWNSRAQADADRTVNAIAEMGKAWKSQTEADPELGPNLDKVKVDIARALDVTLSAKEREAFNRSMDQTMAGNNPEFIRTIWKLAQRAAPGTHVSGRGPSPNGQTPSGQTQRPSMAAALYPNLPS